MKDNNEVKIFLDNLDHPLKALILALRSFILDSDKNLTEHIKWKAPSFCQKGEDRITMKLFPTKNVQLVFHRGAKVKTPPKNKLIEEDVPLLKWATTDRAVATFDSLHDFEAKSGPLKTIITKWLAASE